MAEEYIDGISELSDEELESVAGGYIYERTSKGLGDDVDPNKRWAVVDYDGKVLASFGNKRDAWNFAKQMIENIPGSGPRLPINEELIYKLRGTEI